MKICVVSVSHPYGALSLKGTPNSPALVTNTIMAPDRIPGITNGRVMVIVVLSKPAPVVLALSSREGSIRLREPITNKYTSGAKNIPVTHITPHILSTFSIAPSMLKTSRARLFNSPVCGSPRLCQAMAPIKGLKKKGIRLKGSNQARPGQFVRALVQANETPSSVARTVQPEHIIKVFTKALGITGSVTIVT